MARPIVRAVNGITLSKRIVFDNETIADAVSANYDTLTSIPLIVCQEAQDEEVEANGSVAAQVPLYSRLTAIKGNFLVRSASATLVRFVLAKAPDGEDLYSNLDDTSFHGSDDTPTARERRKFQLAKGILSVNGDRLESRLRFFVSKKAWARASPMRENDELMLYLAKDTAGSTASLDGFGTVYCRANG